MTIGESGIILGAKHIAAIAAGLGATLWASWRFFVLGRLTQLNRVTEEVATANNNHALVAQAISNHGEALTEIKEGLMRIHERIDALYKDGCGRCGGRSA